ncbi:MAG: aldehyde dehydrogenase family protein, partial [Oscillospiraceae bacterium]
MELYDVDLQSIQETRILLKNAYKAQKKLAALKQNEIDKIVSAISEAGISNAARLANMANEETGFGIYEDKVLKNLFAAKTVYEAIKTQKTVGIISHNEKDKTIDIGVGVGIIAGIVPSTNPTSTVIYKSLISIKGGNTIVFSPHPSAKKCTIEAVKIIAEAAEKAGCPKGAISVISTPTLASTNELMKSEYTSLILATGGGAMVKAAYSSGTPAIGVGAGNGPAYIDKSADIKKAITRIFASKTFDNGTICASEQSIIIEKSIESIVVNEIEINGGYILSESESKQLGQFVLRSNGTMNPQIVGKSVKVISELAGLNNIPTNTKILIAREKSVGEKIPYSKEKLAP